MRIIYHSMVECVVVVVIVVVIVVFVEVCCGDRGGERVCWVEVDELESVTTSTGPDVEFLAIFLGGLERCVLVRERMVWKGLPDRRV